MTKINKKLTDAEIIGMVDTHKSLRENQKLLFTQYGTNISLGKLSKLMKGEKVANEAPVVEDAVEDTVEENNVPKQTEHSENFGILKPENQVIVDRYLQYEGWQSDEAPFHW